MFLLIDLRKNQILKEFENLFKNLEQILGIIDAGFPVEIKNNVPQIKITCSYMIKV